MAFRIIENKNSLRIMHPNEQLGGYYLWAISERIESLSPCFNIRLKRGIYTGVEDTWEVTAREEIYTRKCYIKKKSLDDLIPLLVMEKGPAMSPRAAQLAIDKHQESGPKMVIVEQLDYHDLGDLLVKVEELYPAASIFTHESRHPIIGVREALQNISVYTDSRFTDYYHVRVGEGSREERQMVEKLKGSIDVIFDVHSTRYAADRNKHNTVHIYRQILSRNGMVIV